MAKPFTFCSKKMVYLGHLCMHHEMHTVIVFILSIIVSLHTKQCQNKWITLWYITYTSHLQSQQGYAIDLFSCKWAWISRASLKSGKAATIILTISGKPGNQTLRGKIGFKGKPRVKNAYNEYL